MGEDAKFCYVRQLSSRLHRIYLNERLLKSNNGQRENTVTYIQD